MLGNTSGPTFNGGTFNVLEQLDSGEGIMDFLHPSERRLISYAVVRAVKDKNPLGSRRVTRVTVAPERLAG